MKRLVGAAFFFLVAIVEYTATISTLRAWRGSYLKARNPDPVTSPETDNLRLPQVALTGSPKMGKSTWATFRVETPKTKQAEIIRSTCLTLQP